jgi:hypothetical protein
MQYWRPKGIQVGREKIESLNVAQLSWLNSLVGLWQGPLILTC